jgi:BirA family biotin operon repressor/biotin-[acetyl-CoA-carboxylase] ligase
VKLAWQVARALGDGRFHSGETLAADFDVSRTLVWRAIHALEDVGLEIHSVTGKGYRLAEPVDWLDARRIAGSLAPACRKRIAGLRVLEETDSTNQRLLDDGPPPPGRLGVCVAEYQSGGRGRRGRRWQSPPGGGIWLSVSWLFERQPSQLTALGLAAGVAARAALQATGIEGVTLKWPNDLVCDARKLGGLLVELRAESNGPTFVVIGVGVNWRLPRGSRELALADGGLPVVDVAQLCAGSPPPPRDLAVAALVGGLCELLSGYEENGFDAWRDAWAAADALAGRPVRVLTGDGALAGTARGVDRDGALKVETATGVERIIAGEVSVRAGA